MMRQSVTQQLVSLWALSTLLSVGFAGLCLAQDQDCEHLVGKWSSAIGTEVTIKHVNQSNNHLDVSFKSSNTLFKDGPFQGIGLVGQLPVKEDDGNTSTVLPLTMSFLWPEGSVSAFTGYCTESNKKPLIKLMWHESQPVAEKSIYHIHTNSIVLRPKGL